MHKITLIASYLISTSNHNSLTLIMSLSFIASYLISTSNHNLVLVSGWLSVLLLISFLHQTTTVSVTLIVELHCFLSHFYIKPQLHLVGSQRCLHCFLSHFYIKPQHIKPLNLTRNIASYLISTSNHNLKSSCDLAPSIASYLISTSNHNHQ